jgi:hypothetical protein
MDYGGILSKAWQIIWKHKVLWIFGILAGCSQAGGSGGGNSGFRFSGGRTPRAFPGRDFGDVFTNLQIPEWLAVTLVVVGILVLLVIVILAIVLGTVGQVGLIQGANQADQGAERLVFGELFSTSLRYFWRVFGLNLLIFLAAIILSPVWILLIICTCGLAAIVLAILLPLYLKQVIISLVLEDLGVIDGLKRGWQVFTGNFGPIFIVGIILFVISLVVGLVVALPVTLLLAPIIAGGLAGSDQALQSGLIVSGLCFIGYLPILLFLVGVLRSYTESAWTLTYVRLTRRPDVMEAMPVPVQG